MYCITCLPIEHPYIWEAKPFFLNIGECENCNETKMLAIYETRQWYCEECQNGVEILKSKDSEINIVQYERIRLTCGHIIDIDYER